MITAHITVKTITVIKNVAILTQDIIVDPQPSSPTQTSCLSVCPTFFTGIFGVPLTPGPELVLKKLPNLLLLKRGLVPVFSINQRFIEVKAEAVWTDRTEYAIKLKNMLLFKNLPFIYFCLYQFLSNQTSPVIGTLSKRIIF